jgi:hypothetical protein
MKLGPAWCGWTPEEEHLLTQSNAFLSAVVAQLAGERHLWAVEGRVVQVIGRDSGKPEAAASVRRFGVRVQLWRELPTMYLQTDIIRLPIRAFAGARPVLDSV